jgi:putative membrane protein
MRRIALIGGLAALSWLLAREGLRAIIETFAAGGWSLCWLLPLRLCALMLDVRGWSGLLQGDCSFGRLCYIAAVRESVNRLLPVANIGGEFVGISMLRAAGTPGALAAASVAIEMLMHVIAQYIWVAVGLVSLTGTLAQDSPLAIVTVSLTAALPLLLALLCLRGRTTLASAIDRAAEWTCGTLTGASAWRTSITRLRAQIKAQLHDPHALIASAAWQFAALCAAAVETWLVLRWIGRPVSFPAAVAIDSLAGAARSLVFMVPAGLGVQEGALIGLGHLLGIGADSALTLSMVKRARELAFGLPVIAVWYFAPVPHGSQSSGEPSNGRLKTDSRFP